MVAPDRYCWQIFDEVFELSGLDVLTDHSAHVQQDQAVERGRLAELSGVFRLDPVVIYLRFLVAGSGGMVAVSVTILFLSLTPSASSRSRRLSPTGSA